MVCHGELARLKPSPRHLTEFYLLIAAGGAMGGLFVGIVAPLVFSTYLEWQIGVAASAVLGVGLLVLPRVEEPARRYATAGGKTQAARRQPSSIASRSKATTAAGSVPAGNRMRLRCP